MSQQLSKTKYTYSKNFAGTFNIYCPILKREDWSGLCFESELITQQVVEELNNAIKFGEEKTLPKAYVPGWTGDDDVFI